MPFGLEANPVEGTVLLLDNTTGGTLELA